MTRWTDPSSSILCIPHKGCCICLGDSAHALSPFIPKDDEWQSLPTAELWIENTTCPPTSIFFFRALWRVAVLSSYDATCGFTSGRVAATQTGDLWSGQCMNHREQVSMCAGSKMTLPWPLLHKCSLFLHVMFCSAEPDWIRLCKHFRLSVAHDQPTLVVWHQLRHPTEWQQHGQCHLRVFRSVLSEKTVEILLILAIIPNLPTLQVDITLACLCLLTLTSHLTLMRFLFKSSFAKRSSSKCRQHMHPQSK